MAIYKGNEGLYHMSDQYPNTDLVTLDDTKPKTINYVDVEDQYKNKPTLSTSTSDVTTSRVKVNNNRLEGDDSSGVYKSAYGRPGSFFANSDNWTKFGNAILEESFKSMGSGGYTNVLQNFLSRMDRHGTALVPLNNLNYGYTFITRPRLNFTTVNLLQHPVLSTLITEDENSVGFMIRGLLDTCISGCYGCGIKNLPGLSDHSFEDIKALKARAINSALLDRHNPFLIPLCNGLKGISGFPDFNLEATPIGEDFHSGDWTFVRGSDMLNRTQELSLEFRDVQGSIILSIFFYWCLYIALQCKNVVQAYPDDIYQQRLNYTVSIYRFITDASRSNILWWSKATGCFPKSAPVGALFNVNQGEVTISAAQNFSIPFTANVIEYNNPGILYDFKYLVSRYAVGDNNYNTCVQMFNDEDIWPIVPEDPLTHTSYSDWNYIGLPDIVNGPTGVKLVWRTNKQYQNNWPGSNLDSAIKALDNERTATVARINQMARNNR